MTELCQDEGCPHFGKDHICVSGQHTYYCDGKNADFYVNLSDIDFAWEITKAAMDIADCDVGPIEKYMPITAMLDEASKRITQLNYVARRSVLRTCIEVLFPSPRLPDGW